MRLYLASTSPRRSSLLTEAGIDFEVVEPGEEVEGPAEVRARAVARARSKASTARVEGLAPGFVLGVDTVVALDGVEFGKPVDAGDAERMLRALSGRVHQVITAHVLRAHPQRTLAVFEATTTARVRCETLTPSRIAAHAHGRAWIGKAGGYGIQDAEVDFMELLDGDRDTVIGMSVDAVRRLLDRAGEAGA